MSLQAPKELEVKSMTGVLEFYSQANEASNPKAKRHYQDFLIDRPTNQPLERHLCTTPILVHRETSFHMEVALLEQDAHTTS